MDVEHGRAAHFTVAIAIIEEGQDEGACWFHVSWIAPQMQVCRGIGELH